MGAKEGNQNARAKNPRNKFMQFRATAKEIKFLKGVAEISNMSVSKYIRLKLELEEKL